VTALSLISFVASLPVGYDLFSVVCDNQPSRGIDIGDSLTYHIQQPPCIEGQLTLDGARSLSEMGLSVQFYAEYSLGLYILFVAVSSAVALVIFWRRPSDPMAVFVSLTLIIFSVSAPDFNTALVTLHPAWEGITLFLTSLGWTIFPLLFFLFPDGHFVPRWTRIPAAIWIAIQASPYVLFLVPDSPLLPSNWPVLGQGMLLVGLFISCLVAQVYRYRHVPSLAERQQTKWVVLGMLVSAVALIVVYLPQTLQATMLEDNTAYQLTVDTFSALALLLIPLTIAFAILRYRLWDIDILINRALVYVALTAVLLVVYLI
jgi:hypothetical protein